MGHRVASIRPRRKKAERIETDWLWDGGWPSFIAVSSARRAASSSSSTASSRSRSSRRCGFGLGARDRSRSCALRRSRHRRFGPPRNRICQYGVCSATAAAAAVTPHAATSMSSEVRGGRRREQQQLPPRLLPQPLRPPPLRRRLRRPLLLLVLGAFGVSLVFGFFLDRPRRVQPRPRPLLPRDPLRSRDARLDARRDSGRGRREARRSVAVDQPLHRLDAVLFQDLVARRGWYNLRRRATGGCRAARSTSSGR